MEKYLQDFNTFVSEILNYHIRMNTDLNIAIIAEKIGVSRNTYMKWENYESFPDAMQLIMLANLFECSMDAFYFPVNAS